MRVTVGTFQPLIAEHPCPTPTGFGAACSGHIACHGINLSVVGLMRH
ncbi:hypothetical protein SS05631_c36140 [Sinorhizobium sp. CCBAU 05631]|nr:hypothetical protein SS05631_c36140 [Sinorhizobium sp. CCBAU 05631]